MLDKQTLRKDISRKKRLFTEEELRKQSLPVIKRLLSHSRLKAAHTIFLYYALPSEVDTHELIDRLHRAGKLILLPAVTGDGEMVLKPYNGKQHMKEGAYHIMEPTAEAVRTSDIKVDVAIVPGLAFDREGHRLGHGGGYYDRLLKQMPDTYKIGLAFDFQKVDHVPTSPADIDVDEVI